MKRKTMLEHLEQYQVDFITAKVKELKGYKEVCNFYNKKDTVGAFAKQLAAEMYDQKYDDELEPESILKPQKTEAKTVKRKKKVEELAEVED